jgi:hypothetical protein
VRHGLASRAILEERLATMTLDERVRDLVAAGIASDFAAASKGA